MDKEEWVSFIFFYVDHPVMSQQLLSHNMNSQHNCILSEACYMFGSLDDGSSGPKHVVASNKI